MRLHQRSHAAPCYVVSCRVTPPLRSLPCCEQCVNIIALDLKLIEDKLAHEVVVRTVFQSVQDIVLHIQIGKQRIILKYNVKATPHN